MRIKYFLLISFGLLFFKPLVAQQDSVTIRGIYIAVIENYYKGKNENLTVIDTTVNHYIYQTDFNQIADRFYNPVPPLLVDVESMDTSWVRTFREAEKNKYTLHEKPIPHFHVKNMEIQFVKKPIIINHGMIEKVTLSNVIIIGKRAIVEFNRISSGEDGMGILFVLEECKGKWKIISQVQTWIS